MSKRRETGVYFIFLWAISVCVSGNYACPPAVMIDPCTCTEEIIPTVTCNHILSVNMLNGVFEKSVGKPFFVFQLNNSSFMYIPGSAVQTKKFFVLSIRNVLMASIFEVPPEAPNELRFIYMQNVLLQRGVDWSLFQNLDQLYLFQAEGVTIRVLGESFVANMNQKLENFILIETETRKLHDDAFQRMKNLAHIQINDAQISTLKRSMFATPANLHTFSFQGNRIKSLPEDIFVNMPKLQQVDLSNNAITVVSENIFTPLALVSTELKGNPVMCNCSVYWIVERNISSMEGTCSEPMDKRGKDFEVLTADDFFPNCTL